MLQSDEFSSSPDYSTTRLHHLDTPLSLLSCAISPCSTNFPRRSITDLVTKMDEGLFIMCIVTFIVLYVILSSDVGCPHPYSHVKEDTPNAHSFLEFNRYRLEASPQSSGASSQRASAYNSRGAREQRRRGPGGRARFGVDGSERDEYELVDRRESLMRRGL
jgi:hypothetical protein